MKKNTKRVLAVVTAIVGCAFAWGFLTPDQAKAVGTLIAAVAAAWVPGEEK